MTKFDTETVKMVADALGCSVPTAAARREAAEMLLSLVAERDALVQREDERNEAADEQFAELEAERDAALAEVERLRKTLGE